MHAWHLALGTLALVHLSPPFPLGMEHKSSYSTIGCPSLDVLQTDDVLGLCFFCTVPRTEMSHKTVQGKVNDSKGRESTFKILEHVYAKTHDIDRSLFL